MDWYWLDVRLRVDYPVNWDEFVREFKILCTRYSIDPDRIVIDDGQEEVVRNGY